MRFKTKSVKRKFISKWLKMPRLTDNLLTALISLSLAYIFFGIIGTKIDHSLDDTPYHDYMWVTIGFFFFIAAIKAIKENCELKAKSFRDPLTGFYNGGFIEKAIQITNAIACRQKERFAVFVIDVNWLKEINDGHGHHAGSAAIEFVANVMRSVFSRANDFCIRFGGDELSVLCATNDPTQLYNEIRDALAEENIEFMFGNRRIPLSAAVGYHTAVPLENPRSELELQGFYNECFKLADEMMYGHKAFVKKQRSRQPAAPS